MKIRMSAAAIALLLLAPAAASAHPIIEETTFPNRLTHILFAPDHLLIVLALVLLAWPHRRLQTAWVRVAGVVIGLTGIACGIVYP